MIKKIANYIFRDIPIHIINIVTFLLPNNIISNRIRGSLIGPFLGKAGKSLQIGRNVIINNPQNIFLGDRCYISHFSYIQGKGGLYLDDNVIIGPMTIVATSNHIRTNNIVQNKGISKSIKIGKGSWIGGQCTILSGISIGEGVVVGAGSVVTKDVKSNSTVYGSPAK